MPSTATDRLNGLTTSVAMKAPCRTVALTNITLSGEQTINGVAVVEGDRVLVTAQSSSVNNGIYKVSTGDWVRALDFDGNRDVVQGTIVPVVNGSSGANIYEVTSANPITIDTTALTFSLRYGANIRYDRTAAEISAGVTPADYAYKEGWAKRYGAVLDGVTDDTAALKRCLDFCIAASVEAVLDGNALVTGPITSDDTLASGNLYIRCVEDVTITVSAGATAFNTLIKCRTTAINSSVIRGGRLTLDLNEKCANGIYLRHAGTDGGIVDWGPITVIDAKNNDAADINENQGLLVYGRYARVTLHQPTVYGVDRTNTTGGACKGISISETVGPVTLDDPKVDRVLCTGSSADADGIAVFAHQLGGDQYAARPGNLRITNPAITDCQGRSIKTQVSESIIIRPVIRRKSVVAFSGAVDIDHQIGGDHVVLEPSFEYLKNGSTAPFGAVLIPIGLQQRCTDRPNRYRVSGGSLRTEAALSSFAYMAVGSTSKAGEVSIDDVEFLNIGSLATTPITRAVFELSAGEVQAATSTHVSVRNIRGNFSDCPLLGYIDASAANTSKLSFDLVGNENTGADHADSKCFVALSGTTITQVGGFNIRDNPGFSDYLGTWVFDALALKSGCRFVYERATSTVTNGPTIASGSYVTVECLGSLGVGYRNVRMTVDDANAADTVFYTQTGTWGTIK